MRRSRSNAASGASVGIVASVVVAAAAVAGVFVAQRRCHQPSHHRHQQRRRDGCCPFLPRRSARLRRAAARGARFRCALPRGRGHARRAGARRAARRLPRAASVTIRTAAVLDLAPLAAALEAIDGDLVIGPSIALVAASATACAPSAARSASSPTATCTRLPSRGSSGRGGLPSRATARSRGSRCLASARWPARSPSPATRTSSWWTPARSSPWAPSSPSPTTPAWSSSRPATSRCWRLPASPTTPTLPTKIARALASEDRRASVLHLAVPISLAGREVAQTSMGSVASARPSGSWPRRLLGRRPKL